MKIFINIIISIITIISAYAQELSLPDFATYDYEPIHKVKQENYPFVDLLP